MVDGSLRTPGTGELIHTDEYTHSVIGAGKTQLFKQVDGALGSEVPINAGGGVEANALRTVPATSPTATLTNLASSATSAQALASTAGRRGCMMFNDDANAVLIKFGTTASATSYTVKIPADSYWEMPAPIYTGRIDAIWLADGSGSLRITELT